MKRITALFLALLTVVTLASCGTKPSDTADEFEYSGELFGPVDVGEGIEKIYVGLDTGFVYVFKESETKIPYRSYASSGFDDVENSIKSITAADADFDGYTDLIIPFRRIDDYQYYYVYLWNNDGGGYSLVPSASSIGNLEVRDGYVAGVVSEHGSYEQRELVWKDGELVGRNEEDEWIGTAREYVEGYLGKDAFSLTPAGDELIDMALSRRYFVTENGEVTSYIAVTYDSTRAFTSPLTNVYTEIVEDGGEYREGESFPKTGNGGVAAGHEYVYYSELSAGQKEYYDLIAEMLRNYDEIAFESPDAPAAMEAYMKDHPEASLCFVPQIVGYSVKGKYLYTWDNYSDETSKDVLAEKMNEYSERISSAVGEMPVGLSPLEKYVYLAQKLHHLAEEEHHEGKEGGMSIYLPGDSLDERAAKTYAYMCEKAELYCTRDGEFNYIMEGGEKRAVRIYDTFTFSGGSDEWFEAYFAEEEK